MSKKLFMTPRTQVKRLKERADYDQALIFAAIDEAIVGVIAFHDGINIHAIPTAIWREGEYLYVHGSNGSRLLKHLQTGAQVCVSISNIHGFVLARSAFHHSINYNAVCIYGAFEIVAESDKEHHMKNFMEHWMPGRWQHVRKPNKNELAATTVMRIAITEAVLKSRQGLPKDDVEDMDQPVWAGIMPLHLQLGTELQVIEQSHTHLPGKKMNAQLRKFHL